MQSVTYYFTFWKNVILLQLLITYYFFALCPLKKEVVSVVPLTNWFWQCELVPKKENYNNNTDIKWLNSITILDNLTYFDFIQFIGHSVSFILSDKDWRQLLLHCRLCHTSVYLKFKAAGLGGEGGHPSPPHGAPSWHRKSKLFLVWRSMQNFFSERKS